MMAVSEAQRRAVAKYAAKAYDRVLVRVQKGEREKIRDHATKMGESLNAFATRALSETMERDSGGETASAEQPGNDPLLSTEAMEMVRQAAECTGETISEFLVRAAKTQAQRDKRSLMMGINPAQEKPKG